MGSEALAETTKNYKHPSRRMNPGPSAGAAEGQPSLLRFDIPGSIPGWGVCHFFHFCQSFSAFTLTKHDQSQFSVRFNNYSSTPVFMQSLAWHNIFGMEVLLLLLTSTGALTTCLLPETSTKTLEVRDLEIWRSDPCFFFQFLWLAPNYANNWLGYVQHGAWRVHCFQATFSWFWQKKKTLKTWR